MWVWNTELNSWLRNWLLITSSRFSYFHIYFSSRLPTLRLERYNFPTSQTKHPSNNKSCLPTVPYNQQNTLTPSSLTNNMSSTPSTDGGSFTLAMKCIIATSLMLLLAIYARLQFTVVRSAEPSTSAITIFYTPSLWSFDLSHVPTGMLRSDCCSPKSLMNLNYLRSKLAKFIRWIHESYNRRILRKSSVYGLTWRR